ncbi:MAG TPA: TIGR00725 family protein [Candidatus Omnitrophota bacterium]|nr:TIGR00725 family protein [Candidatus Omnitrophota bacterium]HPN87796.1 TIGR00725 family protein [Candidatus Omnitrophota bacterium]
MKKQKITISVIGGHDIDKKTKELAYKVGKIVAKAGAVLVCGGLSGVMESASRGAKEAGGLTIGLLPGKEKKDANPYIDIALPTTIGFARNAMVACCADIIIALPGSHGTLSEICYGLVYKKPIIDLGEWNVKGMISVKSLKDAEQKIKRLIKDFMFGLQ